MNKKLFLLLLITPLINGSSIGGAFEALWDGTKKAANFLVEHGEGKQAKETLAKQSNTPTPTPAITPAQPTTSAPTIINQYSDSKGTTEALKVLTTATNTNTNAVNNVADAVNNVADATNKTNATINKLEQVGKVIAIGGGTIYLIKSGHDFCRWCRSWVPTEEEKLNKENTLNELRHRSAKRALNECLVCNVRAPKDLEGIPSVCREKLDTYAKIAGMEEMIKMKETFKQYSKSYV